MSDSAEHKPVTCSKYIIDGDSVTYTKSGYSYYKSLFAQVGISIDVVTTVAALTSLLEKCKPFEIEFAIIYGESPEADLQLRWLSALLSCKFEEADRLEALIDRKEKLKSIK